MRQKKATTIFRVVNDDDGNDSSNGDNIINKIISLHLILDIIRFEIEEVERLKEKEIKINK